MASDQELPKIDKYTCCFENPVLEKRYREDQWKRHQKFIDGALIFCAVLVLIDVPILAQSRGSLMPMIVVSPIFATLILAFRFTKESIRAKYYQLCLGVFLATFHFYQQLLVLGGGGFEATPADLLALEYSFTPVIYVFIFILMPLRFIIAISMAILITIASGPAIIKQLGGNYQYLASTLIPFIILAWNKWRTEQNSRRDYSKTVSIEETRHLMHQTLQRYFGETLSDKILTQDGELYGETRWVTLSFTDLASYSTILERMSPSVAVEFLNEYFTAMHEVIEAHGGQILNYIGDAVMVIYGAPADLKSHENQAVKCALEMSKRLEILNEHWEQTELSRYWQNHGIDKITARTGLHTGNAITGNLGSAKMLQYSAIGDVVNVAARLEQANKQFGSSIAFSQEIQTALTRDLYQQTQFLGEIQLKGREGATKVFTISSGTESSTTA